MEIPSSRQKASTDPVRRSNRQSRSRHRTRSASLTDRAIAMSPELNSEESLEASQVTGAVKNGCGWRLHTYDHSASTNDDHGSDFDQPGSPVAGEPLSHRVALSTTIEECFSLRFVQRFAGQLLRRVHFRVGGSWLRTRRRLSQANHAIQRRHVQVQAEKMCHESMVAQPVGSQFAFQFLVPVLAFTTKCGVVVNGARQHLPAVAVRHHGASIGSL